MDFAVYDSFTDEYSFDSWVYCVVRSLETTAVDGLAGFAANAGTAASTAMAATPSTGAASRRNDPIKFSSELVVLVAHTIGDFAPRFNGKKEGRSKAALK